MASGPVRGPIRGAKRFSEVLLPFRETAVSAVRWCFLAAGLDCGVMLEGGGLTLTKEAKQEIVGKHGQNKQDTGSAGRTEASSPGTATKQSRFRARPDPASK